MWKQKLVFGAVAGMQDGRCTRILLDCIEVSNVVFSQIPPVNRSKPFAQCRGTVSSTDKKRLPVISLQSDFDTVISPQSEG